MVGRSLYGYPEVTWRRLLKKWSDGKSIFDTNKELLGRLQISLDALDGSSVKDCCLDLGSFPQGQKIPATTLMDMWAEVYNLDYEDIDTYSNLVELEFRNLVHIVCTRYFHFLSATRLTNYTTLTAPLCLKLYRKSDFTQVFIDCII